jgi:hypothetical protein
MSLLIYSCQLSVSDNSFSDGQPCHNEHRCSFLCSLWLNSSNHHVYLTLFWSLPIETSWLTYVPKNAFDFATVIDICNRFSIVHSFSCRLFVVCLSSGDSQTLQNSCYSDPTVTRICPCSN